MWLFSLYFENVTVSSRYCIYRHALEATRSPQANIWVMQTGPEQSPKQNCRHQCRQFQTVDKPHPMTCSDGVFLWEKPLFLLKFQHFHLLL